MRRTDCKAALKSRSDWLEKHWNCEHDQIIHLWTTRFHAFSHGIRVISLTHCCILLQRSKGSGQGAHGPSSFTWQPLCLMYKYKRVMWNKSLSVITKAYFSHRAFVAPNSVALSAIEKICNAKKFRLHLWWLNSYSSQLRCAWESLKEAYSLAPYVLWFNYCGILVCGARYCSLGRLPAVSV